MNAILESHITLALGRDRTPIDGGRNGTPSHQKDSGSAWEKDYGPRSREVQKAIVDASRLHDDGSSYSDGLSGPKRKSGVDNSYSWSGKAFWNEMISSLCPGTRNLFIAAGVLAFIVVI